jgi:hypothetical protein
MKQKFPDCDEEIGEAIFTIGDKFRGLWNSKEVDNEGNIGELKWSVTFLCEGEIVETPPQKGLHEALACAVRMVEKRTKDHCFDCGSEFNFEQHDRQLPFCTVVIKAQTKKCCPECFPKHKEHWMG